MTSPIHLKTVFDAKQPDRFGIHEPLLRLHVASWHRNVRKSTGLTVTLIGDPSPGLAEFLKDLGAEWDQIGDWHPLHHRSPIYNKHLAKPPGTMTDRIYLTDNDTVYLADIDALLAVPSMDVAASLAGIRRVSPELWEQMRRDIDLEVLELDWVPRREEATARVEHRPAEHECYGYFNGGAILFPSGPAFWDLWEKNTYRISGYLESQGLHDRKDAGSDQLSLTTAAAIWEQWSLLPPSYNVFPFQFWVSDHSDDDVDQIHMANMGRAARHLGSAEACALPALLEAYWDLFYRENIHPDAAEKAERILMHCLDLVDTYGLSPSPSPRSTPQDDDPSTRPDTPNRKPSEPNMKTLQELQEAVETLDNEITALTARKEEFEKRIKGCRSEWIDKSHDEIIQHRGHRAYVGAPNAELWYGIGRLQYQFLVSQGLSPHHTFLDIACGSLRLGQYLIPYLEPGRYHGLDGSRRLIDAGLSEELLFDLADQKKPVFTTNYTFDFSFVSQFDMAMAQSLFTHLTLEDIELCMGNLRPHAGPESVFYFTWFEGATDKNPKGESHPNKSWKFPFSDLEEIGSRCGWTLDRIGDWGHPLNQMIVAARLAG